MNFVDLFLNINGKNVDRIGMDCQDKYFKYVGIKLGLSHKTCEK